MVYLMLRLIWFCILAIAFCVKALASGDSVLVVYNLNSSDSHAIAHHYAEQRGIPEAHLIGLDTPDSLTIDRESYTERIHNPLLRRIEERGLIKLLIREGKDELGRLRPNFQSSSIRYLVTVYGIPAHISESSEIDDAEIRAAWFRGSEQANQFINGGLARNEAAVDSELSLLLRANAPLTGFIPNPLFGSEDYSAHPDILRVSRLDGPSPRHVRQMIDRGIEAEQKGLRGRAYVDLDQRGGAYALGNDWLREAATIFKRLGYDTVIDENRAVFQTDVRFDAPALYAGWYAHHVSGVFTLPGFRFAPGAVAVHIHSFSAQNLRQDRRNWSGPLIARGASATVGNTAEPFLGLSHHLQLFFAALANGARLGDAAYASSPALSWQAIVLGDPLYQPFKVELITQLARIYEGSSDPYDSYTIIRAINTAQANDEPDRARSLARRAMFNIPSPAIALKAAQLHMEADEPKQALNVLGFTHYMERFNSMDWMLMAEIAAKLHTLQETRAALELMEKLLKSSNLPAGTERRLLDQAIPYADQLGEAQLALRYRGRLQELR